MARVEVTERIAVPPEHVFAFFIPQRMPYWYGAEVGSTFAVFGCAGQFAVGTRVEIEGRLGKKAVSQTAVVSAFEYARLLEWRFRDPYGVCGTERWELSRVQDANGGGTEVRFTSDYVMSGSLARAIDWLITRHAARKRGREYLLRLAKLAELRA